jgi:hypothetical protein
VARAGTVVEDEDEPSGAGKKRKRRFAFQKMGIFEIRCV